MPLLPTTPTFAVITGGLATIPRGSEGWSLVVQSGAAWVGAVGPFVPPYSDHSEGKTAVDITVLCSGAGHKTVLRWNAPIINNGS